MSFVHENPNTGFPKKVSHYQESLFA